MPEKKSASPKATKKQLAKSNSKWSQWDIMRYNLNRVMRDRLHAIHPDLHSPTQIKLLVNTYVQQAQDKAKGFQGNIKDLQQQALLKVHNYTGRLTGNAVQDGFIPATKADDAKKASLESKPNTPELGQHKDNVSLHSFNQNDRPQTFGTASTGNDDFFGADVGHNNFAQSPQQPANDFNNSSNFNINNDNFANNTASDDFNTFIPANNSNSPANDSFQAPLIETLPANNRGSTMNGGNDTFFVDSSGNTSSAKEPEFISADDFKKARQQSNDSKTKAEAEAKAKPPIKVLPTEDDDKANKKAQAKTEADKTKAPIKALPAKPEDAPKATRSAVLRNDNKADKPAKTATANTEASTKPTANLKPESKANSKIDDTTGDKAKTDRRSPIDSKVEDELENELIQAKEIASKATATHIKTSDWDLEHMLDEEADNLSDDDLPKAIIAVNSDNNDSPTKTLVSHNNRPQRVVKKPATPQETLIAIPQQKHNTEQKAKPTPKKLGEIIDDSTTQSIRGKQEAEKLRKQQAEEATLNKVLKKNTSWDAWH